MPLHQVIRSGCVDESRAQSYSLFALSAAHTENR